MHFQPVENMDDDTHITRAQEGYQVDASASNDALDDVFGSSPSSPTQDRHEGHDASHPSDINRLQTEHTTAGYREGITAAKESHIQVGFDEGFSLGASVGLKAGQLLGLIEGIAEAVHDREDEESAKVTKLLGEAQGELSAGTIFSPEYWAEDGNWKYEVEAKDGDEAVFADVADAHPVIQKWTAMVDAQVALWKIDQQILDDESGQRLETVMDEPIVSSAGPAAKKPLDW
ncbi:Fc.00g041490.m01.CDS01 [Cosmosporella sp. VM-42]